METLYLTNKYAKMDKLFTTKAKINNELEVTIKEIKKLNIKRITTCYDNLKKWKEDSRKSINTIDLNDCLDNSIIQIKNTENTLLPENGLIIQLNYGPRFELEDRNRLNFIHRLNFYGHHHLYLSAYDTMLLRDLADELDDSNSKNIDLNKKYPQLKSTNKKIIREDIVENGKIPEIMLSNKIKKFTEKLNNIGRNTSNVQLFLDISKLLSIMNKSIFTENDLLKLTLQKIKDVYNINFKENAQLSNCHAVLKFLNNEQKGIKDDPRILKPEEDPRAKISKFKDQDTLTFFNHQLLTLHYQIIDIKYELQIYKDKMEVLYGR